jgi:quercetin dioxygenase-like cupin family protein
MDIKHDEEDTFQLDVAPYEEWQKAEGIPSLGGFCIEDLNSVPLSPWVRTGGLGSFINLIGAEMSLDGYLVEIPPGRSLKPEHHMYEELIFVLQGRGATTIWTEEGGKQSLEWEEGSLFSPPLNVWHQHFNGQGDRPVRLVAITNAPLMINLFHNLDFIFGSDYVFSDRYSGEEDYFSVKGKAHLERIWETNFVANVYDFGLKAWPERGIGTNMMLEMASNTITAHISEFPVGTYKKAHRHGSTAHLIILSGKGYSLMWDDGGEKVRVDWSKGSMFSNGHDKWFHQHFNTGREPARYLALRDGSRKYGRLSFICSRRPKGWVSTREGGFQIEYEDEDPEIRRLFESELAKVGEKCTLPPVVRREV